MLEHDAMLRLGRPPNRLLEVLDKTIVETTNDKLTHSVLKVCYHILIV